MTKGHPIVESWNKDEEMAESGRILIADDQPDVLAALRLLLKGEGFETLTAQTPEKVLEILKSDRPELLLMDLNYARDTTSGREGLGLLKSIRALDRTLPVIVLTGWASLDLAVECLRGGVSDFIQKPWDNAKLLATLRTHLGESRRLREKRRREAEMAQQIEEAEEIQRGLLPRQVASVPGCRMAVSWKPSSALSGDYFDVLRFDPSRFGICIADVVGKGVPAALLMSNFQAMVKSVARAGESPRDVCGKLNSFVCGTVTSNKFITFFYAHLDMEERTLRYSNAGHNPPILARRDGSWSRLSEGGVVLGVLSDRHYSQGEVSLSPGDRLLLYTDGLPEARNTAGEEFGERRLIEMILQQPHLDPQDLQDRILQSVSEFCGGSPQDDSTLIAIRVE
jgi:phosphoserine phosphatase RsbU/P